VVVMIADDVKAKEVIRIRRRWEVNAEMNLK